MTEFFELGPIRPPSEAYSLLIRVTRNCSWNRCKFCHIYKGEKFELRPVEEIKQDIRTAKDVYDKIVELSLRSGNGGGLAGAAAMVFDNSPNDTYRNVALWMYAGGESAFLQDANSLIMRTDELVEVIRFLKETFPGINRITTYARAKTAAKKTMEEMVRLRDVGLSRIHIGLESGYDPLLQYMDKGVTAAEHIAGGRRVVESGISLSEYVILGLGGKNMWREHAIHTAEVLNEITPEFIRVRTLVINDRMPLRDEERNGIFARETDEEILEEEKLLIEHLECDSNFVSDHINNLLQEVEGKLPQDKEKMLTVIKRFQALPEEERINFRLGRRIGVYNQLDDLNDIRRREVVDRALRRLAESGSEVEEESIYRLLERFI